MKTLSWNVHQITLLAAGGKSMLKFVRIWVAVTFECTPTNNKLMT